MKTITEFDGFKLAAAQKTKTEFLASGKTAEELPQAMGEALKLEGDRLGYLLSALEIAEGREHLKRVVVWTLNEGETAPKNAVQKGDKYYTAEFFFIPQPKRASREHGRHADRDSRDGRKGGRGKKERRGRGRPDRGRPADGAQEHARNAEGAAEDRPERPERPPRAQRHPRREDGPRPHGKWAHQPITGAAETTSPAATARAVASPERSQTEGQSIPGEKRARRPRRRRPRPPIPPGNPKPVVIPVNQPRPASPVQVTEVDTASAEAQATAPAPASEPAKSE